MPQIWKTRLMLLLFNCLLNGICSINIIFPNNDGFVLKRFYQKNISQSPFNQRQNFVLVEKSQSHVIQVVYGPFKIHKIFHTPDRDVPIVTTLNPSTFHTYVDGVNVFVHVLDFPSLAHKSKFRALLHVSSAKPSKRSHRFYCIQIYLQTKSEFTSTFCQYDRVNNACVAAINLPRYWGGLEGINVSIAMLNHSDIYQCSRMTNLPPLQRNSHGTFPGSQRRIHITTLTYLNTTQSYTVLRSKDINIKVPQLPVMPGSKLSIPVSPQKDPDYNSVFIIRVRARRGVRVVGVDPVHNNGWDVYVGKISPRKRTVTVTATRLRKKTPSQTGPREIFHVKLEVQPTVITRTARVVWNINRPSLKSHYFQTESRLISRFKINVDSLERIIAILYTRDILNTAILSGHRQSHRLKVLLVGADSRVRDITNRSMCYSSDTNIVKVASGCQYIYVDGSEQRGGHNVSIIVKYGGHTAVSSVNVWVPERLDIHLSDDKLSQIKFWKVPTFDKPRSLSSYQKHVDMDGITVVPKACMLKYQEAIIEVFTRFIVDSNTKRLFWSHKTAYFKVTHLIKSRLRVADSHIATIHDGLVRGRRPGRTEVQVLSPYGRVMGAREVRVSRDKVSVELLRAFFTTGIDTDIRSSSLFPGAMETYIKFVNDPRKRQEKILMNFIVYYSDKKVVPLPYVDSSMFSLHFSALYSNNVLEQNNIDADTYLVNSDVKSVNYTLDIVDSCRKKRRRVLFRGHLRRSDGPSNSQSTKYYQRDAAYEFAKFRSDINRPNKEIFTVDLPHEVDGRYADSFNRSVTSSLVHFQTQSVRTTHSTLEIGMYSLIAIFSLAITAFVLLCVGFTYRSGKRRKKTKDASSLVAANDWVWLGRATLERNSIMDTKSQALMSDEDFNGNRLSYLGLSDADTGSGPRSANSSNRNSQISTYLGNECSIRITPNPQDDATDEIRSGHAPNYSSDTAASMTTVSSSIESRGRLGPQHFADHDTLMSVSETDHEWDYEAMGMTYDQLLDYFANLRETVT